MVKSVVSGVTATVSVSVARLLVGLTSATPAGVVTVAVFVTAPTALPLAVTSSVKVAVAPGARGVVLVAVTTPPAGAVVVQPAGGVSDMNVVFAGRTSASV